MRKKWIAVIAAIVLMISMIPAGVFAASGSLKPEDIRLTKEITTDQNGNVVYVGYYNQDELMVYVEDISIDDPEESSKNYYFYDDEGELIEELCEWNDGTKTRFTYEYNEDHLLSTMCRYSEDDELDWIEEYTYNASGALVHLRYESREGQVHTEEISYDDSGREILRVETEKENFDSEESTWRLEKTYNEISDLAWTVTTTMYDTDDTENITYTESWEYDDRGNLLSSVEYEEGNLFRTTNFYDSEDRLIRSEETLDDDPEFPPIIWTCQYRPDGREEIATISSEDFHFTTKYYYSLKQFEDVFDTEYFAYPVKWAVDKGITSGISDTEFGPFENCTRAQAVTFLWRAAGKPEPASSVNPFQDVSESDYYYKAVLWAVENGITNGVSADLFGPDQTCNRGQIVTFLYRSKGEPGLGGTVDFTDVKDSDYYYGAVLWAVADGVTNGTSDTTFSPGNNCTRGQIVTFLYRAMEE